MHTHTCARATCSIFCAGCLRDGMLDRVNFKHFVMPYPNYYHLGKNIQWYHQNGVAGMYEEGDGWGSGGELDALKAYGA